MNTMKPAGCVRKSSESKISSTTAELRKIKKPTMEKKRRERINTCLSQLKSLVLEASNKQPTMFTRMEKADILEMAVAHMNNLNQRCQYLDNKKSHQSCDLSDKKSPNHCQEDEKFTQGYQLYIDQVHEYLSKPNQADNMKIKTPNGNSLPVDNSEELFFSSLLENGQKKCLTHQSKFIDKEKLNDMLIENSIMKDLGLPPSFIITRKQYGEQDGGQDGDTSSRIVDKILKSNKLKDCCKHFSFHALTTFNKEKTSTHTLTENSVLNSGKMKASIPIDCHMFEQSSPNKDSKMYSINKNSVELRKSCSASALPTYFSYDSFDTSAKTDQPAPFNQFSRNLKSRNSPEPETRLFSMPIEIEGTVSLNHFNKSGQLNCYKILETSVTEEMRNGIQNLHVEDSKISSKISKTLLLQRSNSEDVADVVGLRNNVDTVWRPW